MEKFLDTVEQRELINTFERTFEVYAETMSALGTTKKTSDLGFSRAKVINACPADFVADFEAAVNRVAKNFSALERCLIRELMMNKKKEQTWLYYHGTCRQYDVVYRSMAMQLGREFAYCGLFPYHLYKKQVDTR